jgi:hypothetical protein
MDFLKKKAQKKFAEIDFSGRGVRRGRFVEILLQLSKS